MAEDSEEVKATQKKKVTDEEMLVILQKITKEKEEQLKKEKEGQKELTKTQKLMDSLKDSVKEMGKDLASVGRTLIGFEGLQGFKNMAIHLVESNSELYRLGVNAGKGAVEGKKLQQTVIGLRTNFGATREHAEGIVKTLSKGNFAGDMQMAAQASYQFARATNTGMEEIASLTNELSKSAGMSEKAIASSYASILKVQQTNGLTDKGIRAIAGSIEKSAFNMKAFGKSNESIKSMIGNTAKLVSSMEKVGIAAETATAMVEKLTDPERIEENIAAYSALGISISDALGGADISGQLQSGMKDFGAKVKTMGPIAGAQYAKAFGISYKDAIKASGLEEVTADVTTPEEQSLDAMNKLTEGTKDLGEKMKDFGNKLSGAFEKMGPAILLAIGIIGPVLMNAISEAIFGGSKKGTKKMEKNIKDTAKLSGEEINEKISKGLKVEAQIKDIQKQLEGRVYNTKKKMQLEDDLAKARDTLHLINAELAEAAGKKYDVDIELSKGGGNNAGNDTLGEKAEAIGHNITTAFNLAKETLKEPFRMARNVGYSIKDAFTSGATHAKTKLGKAFLGAGNVLVKGGKKIASGISNAIKNHKIKVEEKKSGGGLGLGPIAIVLALLAPILGKLMETVKDKLSPLLEKLQPVMDILANIISNLATALGPVLDIIVDILSELFKILGPILMMIGNILSEIFTALKPVFQAILPIIATVLKVLMVPLKIIGKVVQLLAPVLTFIAHLIEWILKPIEAIASWFLGDSEDEMDTTQENTEAINDNTEQQQKNEKAKITNNNGVATSTSETINGVSNGTTSYSSSDSGSSSSSTSTVVSSSEGPATKKMSNDVSEFKDDTKANLSQVVTLLTKIFNKMEGTGSTGKTEIGGLFV